MDFKPKTGRKYFIKNSALAAILYNPDRVKNQKEIIKLKY